MSSKEDEQPKYTLDLLRNHGENAAASVLLFNALCEQHPREVVRPIGEQYPGGVGVPVVCSIAGVEVDVVRALEEGWKRVMQDYQAAVHQKALELVTAAGFDDVHQAIRNAKWEIVEAFKKTGVELDIIDD